MRRQILAASYAGGNLSAAELKGYDCPDMDMDLDGTVVAVALLAWRAARANVRAPQTPATLANVCTCPTMTQ